MRDTWRVVPGLEPIARTIWAIDVSFVPQSLYTARVASQAQKLPNFYPSPGEACFAEVGAGRCLPPRIDGLQIRHHGFCVGTVHVELGHRVAQLFAIDPDGRGQQCDYLLLTGGQSASDARLELWPVRVRLCRPVDHRAALQPAAAVELAIGGVRGMAGRTLPACCS